MRAFLPFEPGDKCVPSDHAPVCIRYVADDYPPSQRAIPKWVAKSPAFRKNFEEALDKESWRSSSESFVSG